MENEWQGEVSEATTTIRCIMLGQYNTDGYEHNSRTYSSVGICPTLSAREYKDPIKVLVDE